LNNACKQRSLIVGMPSGLFSGLPGFGIHTLRRGAPGPGITRDFAKVILFSGGTDLTLSTPAVFLPLLSWVTLRTAISLASQDSIMRCWYFLTDLISPSFEAE
jgi:hypothetical protein